MNIIATVMIVPSIHIHAYVFKFIMKVSNTIYFTTLAPFKGLINSEMIPAIITEKKTRTKIFEIINWSDKNKNTADAINATKA